jgi:hypothetical protein
LCGVVDVGRAGCVCVRVMGDVERDRTTGQSESWLAGKTGVRRVSAGGNKKVGCTRACPVDLEN